MQEPNDGGFVERLRGGAREPEVEGDLKPPREVLLRTHLDIPIGGGGVQAGP
jgi:hypothetical protein